MPNEQKQSSSRRPAFLRLQWWKESKNARRWVNGCAIIALLVAVFISRDPFLQWATEQQTVPPLTADDYRNANNQNEEDSSSTPSTQEEPTTEEEPQPQSSATAEPSTTQETTDVIAETGSEPSVWLPPASGQWDRAYGYGADPTFEDYRFHKGCDMTLEIGHPVLAAAAGTVADIVTDERWGDVVTIQHGGGFESIYKGITASSLAIGQEVAAGDTLGTVTQSPPAEQMQAPHLHFEISLNGTSQNPLDWLNQS